MKWVLRIAGGLSAVLILALAVLLVLGHRERAGQLFVSSEINATPQQLWPWLTEPDKIKQWISWLVEIQVPDGQPHGVGAREVWVMRDENNGGQQMKISAICTEYAPPFHLAAGISSNGEFKGRQSYQLTDLGGGKTRLDSDGKFVFEAWFAKLMEPLITPSAENKMRGDLARLKQLVEASH